jgi:hypothetical protein
MNATVGEAFRKRASEVLKAPRSMEAFLAEERNQEGQPGPRANQPMRIYTDAQTHKPANAHTHIQEDLHQAVSLDTHSVEHANTEVLPSVKRERLHVEIRQDLVNRILDEVFSRKRNRASGNEATQRAIIEEALEEFFQKKTMSV